MKKIAISLIIVMVVVCTLVIINHTADNYWENGEAVFWVIGDDNNLYTISRPCTFLMDSNNTRNKKDDKVEVFFAKFPPVESENLEWHEGDGIAFFITKDGNVYEERFDHTIYKIYDNGTPDDKMDDIICDVEVFYDVKEDK